MKACPRLPRLLSGLLVLGGCGLAAAEPAAPPAMEFAWADASDPAIASLRSSGERLIERIGGSLMAEVDRVLGTKGLDAAVPELHLKQLQLPRAIAGQPRVTAIKRTSYRIRDPRNAPDAAELAVLERIRLALNVGDPPPRVLVQKVTRPDAPAEYRVYRPIAAGPQCILCHGDPESLQPAVRAALERHYPEDKATGYAAFDWRGIIRVSYELPADAK